MNVPEPLTRPAIFQRAWPIILANASVPVLGLVDTAVIGNFGGIADLGAIAFGALIMSFVYWGFGFLRMGTTGFVAQAVGARNEAEVRATLARALALAAVLGVSLILLQWPILRGALWFLDGSTEVERLAADYFVIRIWAAPATLGTFALMGLLIGLGRSRALLLVQLVLNGTNIVLDVWFAGVLGWGSQGIALGTAIAEWASLFVAAAIVIRILKDRHRDPEPLFATTWLRDAAKLKRMLAVNSDIMIRTLLLVSGFSWFLRQSSQFGDVMLAANHILLQLVSFSAFFLDGYAFVAEAVVGEAIGARNRAHFDLAVRRSTELAAGTAILLTLALLLLQTPALHALTDIEPVRQAAGAALPLAALYVLCSFPAFQLDGIFIGATRTRDMRNASLQSVAVFIAVSVPLVSFAGNHGLWLAFVIYVCARAAALLRYFPGLRRSVAVP
ncbi:MAG: MATE family efflux transporter [Pseudomonadales bacterium]|nr:MATE family efflux transporter [Pseudomonadales bacterium]